MGHLTQKAWDKATDYNETVYNFELNELLSHLQGIDDLNHTTRHKPVPMSLLNPEIILPETAFQAIHGRNTGWMMNPGPVVGRCQVFMSTINCRPGSIGVGNQKNYDGQMMPLTGRTTRHYTWTTIQMRSRIWKKLGV